MNIKYRLLLISFTVILISSFFITGGCEFITGAYNTAAPAEQQIFDITTDKALDLLGENTGNPDFALLDVRTPEEYESGHIEGAVNIDFYSDDIRLRLNMLDKDKSYLIYCHSGRRSAGARDIMAELGFREVYNMTGGMLDWESRGYPVVR